MICERCKADVTEEEIHEHLGQKLCDDCYMDALSPAQGCDPWAVYTAKSFVGKEGQEPMLNSVQTRIMDIVRREGKIEPERLVQKLKIKPADLQRELAALRHVEMIRWALEKGKKLIKPW
jgi:hypothetical protein